MVMHPHTKYNWPISKDKNVMAWTRKCYLKTIIWPWGQRSKSHEGHYGMRHTALWSCTHIPNKYYLKNNYLTLRSKSHEGHNSTRHTALWSCTHLPNKHYLKNNYLTLRSKSHEGHYGTRHTALWSCTHIPNIIDLSRKTKMLWPRQENTI
jgi:hypothetical protein